MEATGRAISVTDPDYFSMLTLMRVPDPELHRHWQAGAFQPMKPEAMLAELRRVIEHLDSLSHCVFHTNHASNYLPLAGTLDEALARGRPALRLEMWRGL